MEQLTQNLKDGHMQLLEVPFPALNKGCILVRNHYSVISAGTEGKTVKDARLGYIGKAKSRKEDVKKVIQTARTFGIMNTYNMVMNKLNAHSGLGYSCAGEVIAIADDIKEFAVGDWVACGGNSANHAEVVSIPKNLCVKVPKSISMEHAAYATIGSVALQGVRQADLRLGESCAVIGLGLVGQLTIQLLNAAGIKTCGIDVDSTMLDLAKKNGCQLALNRSIEDLEQQILEFSNGHGVDSVIITAGTSSTDPVNLAGALCRKKGKVIIVGGVATGFDRPNYFKKELDLRMSTSYGPGRYDADYEEKGNDYPIGYVRWTENRNMQAVIELLAEKKLDLDALTTHAYKFDDAKEAYQLIVEKTEPFVGVTLQYNLEKEIDPSVVLATSTPSSSKGKIGLIGAGSFAQNFLLPALTPFAEMEAVATSSGNNARGTADKYGFKKCASSGSEVITDENVDTVFVVTRHNTHGQFVLEAIKNGKNVFVEKPLCLTFEELEEIKEAYVKQNVHVMVGFNRRFAPLTKKLIQSIDSTLPKAINYRINAGTVPANHWVHDPELGGGRIIGEGCHFIDLAMFIAGAPITSVAANKMDDGNNLEDTVVINLKFENGSIATISYFSNGNKQTSKEMLEVFCGGVIATISDFKSLTIQGKSLEKTNMREMDKGYSEEMRVFMEAVKHGGETPIPFNDIYTSTRATLAVLESMRQQGAEVELAPTLQ